MYFRRKTSAGRAYLQIVESRRDGDQVRQQVIATLGRFEDLQASGQLERLVRSGARFAAKAMVLNAASDEAAIKIAVRRIGPALVFERLWEETGCRAVIAALAGQRKHGFALERAVFLTVLHRLFMSGSDRAADRWREDYAIAGVDGLDLHHLYRAMAWLGEELLEKEQDGRTPFAPRCLKDVVEERLFDHRRDLLTRLMRWARISLAVGIIVQLLIISIGVPIGAIAGYFGGRVDNLLMRFVDVMYSFPDLLLIIIVVLVLMGRI